MPIYDYKCSDCNHEFTKLVFNSTEEVECPKCQSKNAQKKVSTPGSVAGSSSGGGCCGSSSSGFS